MPEADTAPNQPIRRFDVFAEYTRQERRAKGYPDDEAKVQAHERQCHCIIERQDYAAQRLATDPGGQDAIHFARLRTDDIGVSVRQP